MIESVKQLPRLKKRTLSSKQQQQPKNILGQRGERRAAAFLRGKGYRILQTNVRLGNKEIDLVCFDVDLREVVFVEVKTRSQDFSGHPSTAVGWQKRAALRKVALQYLREKQLRYDFRFDLVTVLPNSVEHFENITW